MMDFKDIIKMGMEERQEGIKREEVFDLYPCHQVTDINNLSDENKAFLLAMTMQSIRGSWGYSRGRLGIIQYLCTTAKPNLPEGLLAAVLHNSFMFNGNLIDGRIFRDGDRKSGLSGNLSYVITGNDKKIQYKFYGTYDEIWNIIGPLTKDRYDDCYPILNSTNEDIGGCHWEE